MKNVPSYNEFVNEAKITNNTRFADVTSIEDLAGFIEKKFKSNAKNSYTVEINDDQVWLWYDVATRKGYVKATGNVVIDIDSTTLYRRDGFGIIHSGFAGRYDDLGLLLDLIKEYIKDDKKSITG